MTVAVARQRSVRFTAAIAALLLATALAVADAGAAEAEVIGHSLSGTIHLPDGVSQSVLNGIQVVATDTAGTSYWTTPANDGTYSFTGLPADSYTVSFDTGVYYEPPFGYNTPTTVNCGAYGAPVDLTTSDATAIDVTCTKLLSISGTVTLGANTTATWLGGVTVTASGPRAASARVDAATGSYTIPGLVAGNYTVSFSADPFNDGSSDVYPNLLGEFYNDAASAASASPVVVTAADVTGIDATLARGYSISGHITMPDGTPSSWTQGVAVSAANSNGSVGGYLSQSGDYSIYGLPAGSYTVEFAVADYYYDESAGEYVYPEANGEFYNDAAYAGDATPVVVSTANVININAVLESGNQFDDPPLPLITGDHAVGSALSVDPGSWSPGPSTLTYQWSRNGTPIAGATGGNYTIQSADRGTDITVTATGSLDDYPTVSVTSLPFAVPADPFTSAPVPTISGTLKSGSLLTASKGTWTPLPSFTYRWYRSGVAISGATHSTYTLTTSDRGANITVTVTGTKAGYVTTAKTSAAKYVPRVFSKTPVPTITGTPKSGYTLTAHKGTWSPTPTTLTYQWYRNGVKITGATKYTYKLTATDKGKHITVKVTGKRTGYTTVTKTSAYKTIAG